MRKNRRQEVITRYRAFLNDNEKFIEAGFIGQVEELAIMVLTAEHSSQLPIHFHALDMKSFQVRVKLDGLSIIDYIWQQEGKQISKEQINNIKKWLKQQTNLIDQETTNHDAIIFAWNIMNDN